jgi:HK97 family phage portal protein
MRFNIFRKQTPVWNLIVAGKENQPVWSRFKTDVAADFFANIDTVYSCVDVISSGASQAQFRVVNSQNEKEVPNHPAIELLSRPAPEMDQGSLLYGFGAWKLIGGNSYLFYNNGDDENYRDPPTEINILRADRMKPVAGTIGLIGYEYEANGQKRIFPVDVVSGASNVQHSKFFNPTDDFFGLSPMQAASKNIDIYDDSLTWNRSILKNAGRLSGLLKWMGDGDPTPDQVAAIKKEFEQYKGAKNAGGVMFGNRLEFQEMSLTPKDMEYLAGKNMTMKDIARVYKVPPILLNIGSDATFSNMAEARLALWDEAVIPLLKCFVNELNASLMPRYGNTTDKLELVLDSVTSLEPRRESLWKRARESDFLTINERRRMVGFDPVDDGDDVYIPSTSVPLSFGLESVTDSGEGKKKRRTARATYSRPIDDIP